MNSGSCSQMTLSCKCPILTTRCIPLFEISNIYIHTCITYLIRAYRKIEIQPLYLYICLYRKVETAGIEGSDRRWCTWYKHA